MLKVIYKKKIYNGMCELRDYEVNNLVNKNQEVKIIIGDEFMILTPSELKQGKVINTQHSIYNKGQTYKLIGYRWRPTGRLDEQITMPFATRLRLGEIWRNLKK